MRLVNINNKTEIKYKTNSNLFKMNNKLFNNAFKFIIIFIIAAIVAFLLLFITDIGFDTINAFLLRKLIWVILIASVCLVVSTYIVQTITNNNLADTTVLGIGSVNLVILTISIFFLDLQNNNSNAFNFFLPFGYTLGSILASLLIFGLSYKNKFKISKKFVLAGILLNFAFSAIAISLSSILPTAKQNVLANYSQGLIESKNDFHIYFSAGVTIICLLWFYLILKKYKIVTTNNIIANQLGINIRSIYWQAIIISALLTGAGFLLVGNVIFLGLIASNIALFLFKRDYKFGVISSGLIAFIILGLTYFINRNLITNSNVNTSNLVPLIGTPYFLYLILKKQ